MAVQLNENTSFNINIKVAIAIIMFVATAMMTWNSLQAEIEEAKLLPIPIDPEITRVEFDMKDQLIRQTIMSTQEDVSEMKEDLKLIKQKLYE